MPGFLLHVNAGLQCTHMAKATIAPLQPRVVVGSQPVAPLASVIAVAGCPFQIPVVAGTKPQPCVTVKWTMPSTRFLVAGQPAALAPAPGLEYARARSRSRKVRQSSASYKPA
jgi:hypothetical protein